MLTHIAQEVTSHPQQAMTDQLLENTYRICIVTFYCLNLKPGSFSWSSNLCIVCWCNPGFLPALTNNYTTCISSFSRPHTQMWFVVKEAGHKCWCRSLLDVALVVFLLYMCTCVSCLSSHFVYRQRIRERKQPNGSSLLYMASNSIFEALPSDQPIFLGGRVGVCCSLECGCSVCTEWCFWD